MTLAVQERQLWTDESRSWSRLWDRNPGERGCLALSELTARVERLVLPGVVR